MSEPGLISTRAAFAGLAFGERDGRESARVKAFFDACKAAKFDAQIPPDITRAIWLKFAMLAPMAATTSLIRCGLGRLGEQHGVATPTQCFVADALAPYEKGRPE